MNLVLFLVSMIISFVAVRIGAVAFQLTGLEWSLAKFQALSCFSGTGFTTREAELVTGHPKRRKIASILMVFGNAGLVTMVATFANTIRPRVFDGSSSWQVFRTVGPWLNLAIISLSVYAAYRFFSRAHIGAKFTEFIRSRIIASSMVEPVTFEELMVATGGYGVARAEIQEGSPLIEKTLANSGLRAKDITVLVVRRNDETIPNPPPGIHILKGDKLVCFGRLDQMKREFEVAAA